MESLGTSAATPLEECVPAEDGEAAIRERMG